MRWKVTLQFLIAIFIIGIASNFINTAVMSYYFYVESNGISAGRMIVSFDPNSLDVKKTVAQINIKNEFPVIDKKLIQELDKSKSWVQIIDNNGNEIKSVNKPGEVKNRYSLDQIASLQDDPGMIKGYNIFFFPNAIGSSVKKIQPFDDANINGDIPLPGDKRVFNSKLEVGNYVGQNKVQYIIVGVPKPKITFYTFIYSIYNYLTDWTNLKNSPKLISTFLTLLLVLILGYIFARSLTKPVVKITEGIKTMAGGNYDIKYSEKGLYKQVYASLNHMTTELQSNEIERKRIEKMREEWISNISHDLKTPLSSIKGYGELLSEHDSDLSVEERKKYFDIISNKSNYMENLLEDLKLTQKLKNELLPLKKTVGDLNEVLRDVVINILNDTKFDNRKLEFKAASQSLVFSFDALLLQRAFTNIIYNAIVHNPENTKILVRIYEESESIFVEIEDDGRGISDEDKKNLFERYYRGTNTEESHTGSGLGLAIAKQVIEAHGGKIELMSEIGEGTIVKIKF